jgi:hypothetical protein
MVESELRTTITKARVASLDVRCPEYAQTPFAALVADLSADTSPSTSSMSRAPVLLVRYEMTSESAHAELAVGRLVRHGMRHVMCGDVDYV